MKNRKWILGGVLRFSMTLVIGGLFLQSTSSGQDVSQDQVTGGLAFVDEVKVTVVNVDVFVRGPKGQSIVGLERDDFRLLQDGHERNLSHFAAYTEDVIANIMDGRNPDEALPSIVVGEEKAEGDVDDPVDIPGEMIQPVHIVIYVDNENIRPHDRNRVLSQTRRYVRQIMQPHVQVMVVSAQRSATIVQAFTNDSKEVEDALRSMNKTYGARVDSDRQRSRIVHELQEQSSNPASGNNQQAMRNARDLEDMIRIYGEEMSMELDYSISTIREILTTLAGLSGRKALVYVSNGLPAVPARDLIDWYGDIFQTTSSLPMLARFNRRYVFESLASSANSQGVTFYTIDATGLGGNASVSAEYSRPVDPMYSAVYTINYQEPLLLLAEKTGGRALVGANDVTGLLEDMRADLFTYYSLGYTLPASGADTVHRIEVKLPGHPEYDLVYRRTMVEKSLETRVQDKVVSGLMLNLDENPMGIDISAGNMVPAAAEDRWILPVEITLPIASVAMLPEAGEYVGRVILFIANRDSKGGQSDIQRREFQIRMPPEDYETRSHETYVAELNLLLNAGDHKIVVGVLDPVTRQTSFAALEQKVSAD